MMQIRSLAKLGLGSAVALLACATLVAQNPGGMPQQQPQPAQPGMPGQAGQPGQPGQPGIGNGPSNSGPSMGDQSFVSDSMQGNLAEMQMAQLAQQKSQSSDVKQLAQRLESEHSQMNQKWFGPEAKALSVSQPKSPSKKEKKEIEKLQGLSGADFDKEYITAMLKDQQNDLKKYKEESDSAQDPGVKQIAQMGTKVISEHVQLAEMVAKNHNIAVDENGKEISSR